MAAPIDIQGAIFDCDGTLLDSLGGWDEAQLYLAGLAGITFTQDMYDLLATYTTPETGAWFHETYGVGDSSEDVAKMIDDYMLAYYQRGPAVKPGVREYLEFLAQRGVPMTVASSTPHEQLVAGLEATGLIGYFKDIVSVDDVGASKRDPKIFLHCLEVLGTPKEFTWGFDDAIYAIRTLNAAGFKSCGVWEERHITTWDAMQTECTLCVNSMAELIG